MPSPGQFSENEGQEPTSPAMPGHPRRPATGAHYGNPQGLGEPSRRGGGQSHVFLPSVIGPSFMIGLRFSIYLSVVLVLVGAIFSCMRGKKYVVEEDLSEALK